MGYALDSNFGILEHQSPPFWVSCCWGPLQGRCTLCSYSLRKPRKESQTEYWQITWRLFWDRISFQLECSDRYHIHERQSSSFHFLHLWAVPCRSNLEAASHLFSTDTLRYALDQEVSMGCKDICHIAWHVWHIVFWKKLTKARLLEILHVEVISHNAHSTSICRLLADRGVSANATRGLLLYFHLLPHLNQNHLLRPTYLPRQNQMNRIPRLNDLRRDRLPRSTYQSLDLPWVISNSLASSTEPKMLKSSLQVKAKKTWFGNGRWKKSSRKSPIGNLSSRIIDGGRGSGLAVDREARIGKVCMLDINWAMVRVFKHERHSVQEFSCRRSLLRNYDTV